MSRRRRNPNAWLGGAGRETLRMVAETWDPLGAPVSAARRSDGLYVWAIRTPQDADLAWLKASCSYLQAPVVVR